MVRPDFRASITAAFAALALIATPVAANAVPLEPPTDVDPTPTMEKPEPLPGSADRQFDSVTAREIPLGEGVMPFDIAVTADGTTAFVTGAHVGAVFVVDLTPGAERTVETVDLAGALGKPKLKPTFLTLSADEETVIVAVEDGFDGGVVAIDRDRTEPAAARFVSIGQGSLNEIVATDAGVFGASPDGRLYRFNSSGTQLLDNVKPDLPVSFTAAGIDPVTDDFMAIGPRTDGGKTGIAAFTDQGFLGPVTSRGTERLSVIDDIDQVGSQVFFAGGASVGTVDIASGTEPVPIYTHAIGELMAGVFAERSGYDEYPEFVPPDHQRVYGVSIEWEMLLATDLEGKVRSPSYRQAGEATEVVPNLKTGALYAANRGWSSSPGSTITVVDRPTVSAPTQQCETADYSVTVAGIKSEFTGANKDVMISGVQWQIREGGAGEWVDLAGETGTTLSGVETAAHADGTQVRARWLDDFWAQRGETSAVSLCADEVELTPPTITDPQQLSNGTVGTAYDEVRFTATGDEPIRWTLTVTGPNGPIDGPPPGLTFDPETGKLSGTPTTAGTYTLTVTATNEAGSDSKDYKLVVVERAVVPDPAVVSPDPPGTLPGSPGPLPETGGSGSAAGLALGALLLGAGLWATLSRRTVFRSGK